ncbi:hypothetical protein BG003_010230 [Podila horticola]|nr:hypothetical protein BG003_010230 [Podila horticola]
MFVPNGYLTSNGRQNITSMMQYDPVLGTTSNITMAGGPVDHVGFTVTWSTYLKKFVVIGGHQGNTLSTIIYTFEPATFDLGPRTFHCAAAAASGTRIVVVGGFTDVITNPVTSDLAILDLTTNSWVPGQAISSANYGRAGPACGVSDDMVVIWGGERNTGVVSTNVTLVYNMKTNQWTSSFAPSTSSASPPTPSGSNNFESGSGSGSGPGSSGGDGSSNSGGEQGGVTVVSISTVDANNIWQPSIIQPPRPNGSTPQNHQVGYGYEHYSEYDKHHSRSYPTPPSVTVVPSPPLSEYSSSHQQYIYNGKESSDGYIRSPSRSGPQLYSQEFDPSKTEHGEGHKVSPSNARSRHAVSPVPSMVKEERNPQGLIVPNSYVD